MLVKKVKRTLKELHWHGSPHRCGIALISTHNALIITIKEMDVVENSGCTNNNNKRDGSKTIPTLLTLLAWWLIIIF